ncbi:MAG: hypothetical protein KGZ61_13625 [Sandarakinorhabdus sp.]|jgi:hypothetical protein|nr:hypothetical protein [Sandarakinorhabdus sp.]
MSDTSSQSAATIDANEIWQRYLEREAARDALFERLRPANQTAIFDALASAGVVTLVVNFDGFGDSGQIEAMTATGAEGEIALPETCIPYASPGRDDGDDAIDQQPLTLAEAIETLCYDLLRQTHAGWENNDGAFGDFTFDVTARTISLDHNDRYTAIGSYAHQW